MPQTPPGTRRDDTVEMHFGEAVPDPYRWLEDSDSPETRRWVREQAAQAEEWLAEVPVRGEIRDQLTAIWDRETFGAPTSHGRNWFQWRNSGLQPQPVLFVGDTPDDLDRVLLDPNALSTDGTTAVTALGASHDGSLLAWAASEAGSDWLVWRVRDVASGRDLTLADGSPDTVERAKFSGAAWAPDNSGFYYTTPSAFTPGADLVEGQAPMQLRFHALGQSSGEDQLVLETPEQPEWFFEPLVTGDQRWLLVLVSQGTEQGNRLLARTAGDLTADFTVVVPETDVLASPVASDGDAVYLHTDHLAPRGRVVRVSFADPGRGSWEEIIAEDEATLLSAHEFAGGFIVHRLRDAASELLWMSRAGALLGRLEVAPATSVVEVSADRNSHVVHWKTHSFTDPGSVWRQDLPVDGAGGAVLVRRTQLAVDLGELVSEQVFVTSADGTQVPVFLTRRADVAPTGDVPALIYGYGGFNIPITPMFSPTWALWVQRGGLLAVACLRGGGEYGRDWYDGGRLGRKTNVFDDACAVASWLHASGWSRPACIGINGRSNGGLLVGACLTRRPELFGAFVPEVGVLDLLRFHLFTVGWAWKSDYGDPAVLADFQALMEWSPLHRIEPGRALPPVLITTGDHDDRVVPAHSFKFAAALQAALPSGSGPALLRVDIDAGHGAGKPTAMSIAERADVLAFLEATLRA